jgi:hypothetical protein
VCIVQDTLRTVEVSHPDCGPCLPFRALIDTGCQEGVGCIPLSTVRTLMDARVECDVIRYRSANSEVYAGKAFRKCTVTIGVDEWALLAEDVSASYTATNDGAPPHTPLLGFETLCHMMEGLRDVDGQGFLKTDFSRSSLVSNSNSLLPRTH